MKRRIISLIFLVLFGVWWWYLDEGSWKQVPSIELLYQYSSGTPYRTETNEKIDADFFTWYSYFSPEEFYAPEHKAIYEAYLNIDGFDFDRYTYILSYGFSIEQLLYKGEYEEPRAKWARVVHGVNCSADSILLYRIPKSHLNPFPDRRSTHGYKFVLD